MEDCIVYDAEMSKYRYLFPFEKVPVHSKILIYGAGVMGQEYLKQIMIAGYCEVIGFVDRNHAEYPPMIVPMYAPETIKELEFDYVVIALRDGFGIPAIRQVLSEQGVAEERVVCVFERGHTMPIFVPREEMTQKRKEPAYKTAFCPIALYLAGGFGDLICHKHFVSEILRLAPNARIDIYVVKDAQYVEWLYSDMPQIQNIIMDLGSRYSSASGEYALAISVFGAKFLEVNYWNPKQMEHFHVEELKNRIERLKKRTLDEAIGHPIPGAIAYLRRIYNGENCRMWFNYGDTFSIHDEPVTIPITLKLENDAKALELHDYITVNTGNGSSRAGESIAKTWPLERFERVVHRFREKYPCIAVVQIGAVDGETLDYADVHLMGKEFGLVACVLKKSIFHLDIEGGLVHLATQVGAKCIVLFGPTPMRYYAYPQNINVTAGMCHDCYGLYPQTDCCARHMEKPECMYSITPEIVMEEIDKYMSTLESGGREGNIRV